MTNKSLRNWRETARAWIFAVRSSISRFRAKKDADRDFVRSVYGPYLKNTPGDRTFQLCTEGYGNFISDAIGNRDREFLFLDIGANCGVFSLVASRHPMCRKVVAIEPVPQTFDLLQANIAFNGAENVEAVRAAVSDTADEVMHLRYNPAHTGMSVITDAINEDTVTAPVLGDEALSALVSDPGLPVFVKIDVEGSEPRVLAVLRLCSFFPAITDIVIEISERTSGKDGVRATILALEQMGFGEIGRDGPPEHYDAHYRRAENAKQVR